MGLVCRLECLPLKRVYVLLVNWKGWADTLECLESLLHLDYPDFRIVVVDNASTDGSVGHIRNWANNQFDLWKKIGPFQDVPPTTGRAISFTEYDHGSAKRGGDHSRDAFFTVLHSPENRGYAGGNNIGLRFVLARGDAAYVWLLNNDTFADKHALATLVARIQAKPKAGICGSSLLFYERPEIIQALGGGYYCPWLAIAWHVGQRRLFSKQVNPDKVERYLSYIVGASMLVSVEFIRKVGPMTEDYFLYFEEMDWMLRAGKVFSLSFAPGSIVYHKVGASIGTRTHPAQKSLLCDYYSLRNRLVFTRRFYPWALPTVYFGLCIEALVRVCCGRIQRAAMIFRLILCGRNPPPLSRFDGAA